MNNNRSFELVRNVGYLFEVSYIRFLNIEKNFSRAFV